MLGCSNHFWVVYPLSETSTLHLHVYKDSMEVDKSTNFDLQCLTSCGINMFGTISVMINGLTVPDIQVCYIPLYSIVFTVIIIHVCL
jgi:hypothetical protein